MSTIPAGIPPKGVKPNFTNPESLQSVTIGIGVIMTVLAVLVVTISLLEHMKKLRLADYFSIAGLAVSVGFTATICAISDSARHIWDVPFTFITEDWVKLTYSQGILLCVAMFLAKTAIFLFYLHIFKISRATEFAIYAGMAFNFIIYALNIPFYSDFCAPRGNETWLLSFIGTRCQMIKIWALVQSVLAVILDIYIFVLPMPMLSRLKLQRRKKIGVLIVFGTAVIGIVASVIALVFRVELWQSTDQTWVGAENFICNIVEVYTSVIVANMVPAASYFKRRVAARHGWRDILLSLLGLNSKQHEGVHTAEKYDQSIEELQYDVLPEGRTTTTGGSQFGMDEECEAWEVPAIEEHGAPMVGEDIRYPFRAKPRLANG